MAEIFTDADREELARRGLDEAEVRRQLALLRDPPPPAELDRPATLGDGVIRLDAERRALCRELYDEAAAAGRFSKLVPASGAASRMFKALAAVRGGEGSGDDRAAAGRFLEHLERFPFRAELAAAAELKGGDVLAALLDDDGLAYAGRPKGLIPFHSYSDGPRTPFEEHLVEAAAHLADAEGRCRVHFTVLEDHEPLFRAALEATRPRLEAALGVRFEVGFSFQDPSTDTVALGENGRLVRGADGRIVFRPGGHGALIRNLGRLGGDLVVLKNIDNVVPEDRQDVVVEWKKVLGGLLVGLERRVSGLVGSIDTLPDRPSRVCGVVENTGEPGGGPFWVRGADGEISLQIVEMAQIDRGRPDQAAIVDRATHFNPVDVVCAVRDPGGRPYELERFVDPEAVFVSEKSHAGRPLRALEHPGLWNGAMARWNTVFVEVPAATFAPVKTVLDLLRPEHQP